MSKRKVVIIQPALGRYRKGFVESLVNKNHGEFDISIYCSKQDNLGVSSMDAVPEEINYNFVKLTQLFRGTFWQHLVLSILKEKLSSKDSLVINGNPRFLSSITLSLFLKLKGVRIIWWGHAWSATSGKLSSKIRFQIMKFFDVILYTEEELELTKGLITSPVIALNNGLDVKSIRKHVKFSHSKSNKLFKLAFIGRITEKSNFNFLIESLLCMSDSDLDAIELQVIGDVRFSDIISRYPRAKKLNLKLHGEVWDENEISSLLTDCQVFVYPGAVGLSIIHAFAIGLPAIVHNKRLEHMPEIGAFKDGTNGLSFEKDDPFSLKTVILKLRDDSSFLSSLSQNAFNTVTETFNTDDMAERFIQFLRKNDYEK